MCSRLIPPDVWLHVRFTITLSLFASSATSGYEVLIFLSLKVINCICWAVLFWSDWNKARLLQWWKSTSIPGVFTWVLHFPNSLKVEELYTLKTWLVGMILSSMYFSPLIALNLTTSHVAPVSIWKSTSGTPMIFIAVRTDLERKRRLYSMYRFSFRS